ncbi:MAG: hypothetical protein KIT00_03385, partial [Rhodospirillales bacterium]|nr:hypothetical protein [Rhodospirillales bacterium]
MALSDQILSLSPVGYWRFEETSGTTATDAASNHDGAYTNGVGLGTDGIAGNAAEFDGSNDVVLVPHDDAFLLDEGAVHLWFNADDLSGRQGLFSKDASGFGAGGHLSVYLQGDDLVVRLQSTTASNKII